jgi:hypothetical protein
MARDPRERFSTAGELAESLTRAADQRATVTLHASGIRRVVLPILKLPRWIRRLRSKEMRLSLAALTFLAALAFGGYTFWPASSPPPSSNDAATPAPLPEAASPATAAEPPPEANTAAAEPPPPIASDRAPAAAGADKNVATLEIDSAREARVFLDGELVGTAPGSFDGLTPGEHFVALEAAEGVWEQKTLLVTAGSTHRIHFDFTETTAEPARAYLPATVPSSQEGPRIKSEAPEIRRWTGFLTDQDCGATGGEQGALHVRCAEKCIREGKKPMFYARGKLYRLDGLERIELFRDQPLRFRGWVDGNTLHVVAPGAEGLDSGLEE